MVDPFAKDLAVAALVAGTLGGSAVTSAAAVQPATFAERVAAFASLVTTPPPTISTRTRDAYRLAQFKNY